MGEGEAVPVALPYSKAAGEIFQYYNGEQKIAGLIHFLKAG
jgi:hypothetical protein